MGRGQGLCQSAQTRPWLSRGGGNIPGYVLIAEDFRRDYGERRLVALSEYDGEVIRLIFTERDHDIRIISAWKANRNDRKTYQKARADRQV